jgi:hypothetical protein
MREGWMCPRCKLVLAPHINFCDCRERGGEAGQPAAPVITPNAPSGGVSVTPPLPYVVTNTGYPATTATVVYATQTPLGRAA